ncbi:MAG TPA: hypothetical protein VHD33_02865, partial [Legionellaceae bacterium]|nr:hypothetical protein [Legionellaceae bacterium]
VTKDELIDAFPDRCVNTKLLKDNLFPTRSSGSSGHTLRIFVDSMAIAVDTLQGIRQFWLQSNGKYTASDVIANVYTVPWWLDRIGDADYSNIFISSLLAPEKIGTILAEIQPEILSLYPSNLVSIMPHFNPKSLANLQLIVTHSEISSPQERKNLSQQLQIPVLDEYSSEELTRIALELQTGIYHICEDTVRLDIVDPNSMKVMDMGTGLVVGTNLLNTAMPFIRYVQGDYVTIGAQKPSDITWRQIEKIEGRQNDAFLSQNGQSIPAGTILDISYRWMYDIRVNIRQFEIVQTAPNAIRVTVCEPQLSNNDELTNKSKLHLKKLLEYVLDSDIEMDFIVVDKLENTFKKWRPIRRAFCK